jgi:hypothetical protein
LTLSFSQLSVGTTNSGGSDGGSSEVTNDSANFQVYKLLIGHKSYPINYHIEGGQLENITIVSEEVVRVYLNATSDGKITLQIPKTLVARQISSLVSSFDKITNGGTDFMNLRTWTFDFTPGTESLEIGGIIHVPDFLNKNIPTENMNKERDNILPVSQPFDQKPALTNLTLLDVPQSMLLKDPGFQTYDLTLRSLINNGNVTVKEDFKTASSEVSNWNPALMFELPHQQLKLGLINIKNLIIGQIKLYDSPIQMMKSVQYWKNVPLNEEVVLRLDKRGTNFILAEVQFSNGASALYGGVLNVDVSETKDNAAYWFNKDRPQDRKLIVKESKIPQNFEATVEKAFWQAARDSYCSVLKNDGFYVCT